MGNPQQFEVWKTDVEPILELKRDEWHLLGHEEVAKEDVWRLGVQKLNKETEFTPFYRFVNVLMRLSVTDFMNEQTINAYKGMGGWTKDTDDELEGILGDVLDHD
ncbi:post-transcriptional regulator [Natribacillus halophilus]|uniref:Post-transcriptional regulator n=1 Tax=Natribacillus halophilus TaxID=549003 RepID=A0A1G8NYI8_9BACI|nr:post-transcriptional regulator [Natribacillus halophilus]SDI85269.1 Post-transcriptional regulator [Natribacillus halophilus]